MKSFILNFLLTIISFIILFSCLTKQENKILLNNLNDFSSGGCFVYIDVKYGKNVYTVIITNTALYKNLKHHLFAGKLSEEEYTKLVREVIKKKKYLEINKELNYFLEGRALNVNLENKYRKEDILNKGYIQLDGSLSENIDYENEKAIIYALLSKQLKNCCKNSESGRTVVF